MGDNQSLQLGQFDLYGENLLGKNRCGSSRVFVFSLGQGARAGRVTQRSKFKTPLPVWLSEC